MLRKRRAKLRSPIKGKLLRDPGQSLDSEIGRTIERALRWIVAMGWRRVAGNLRS